MKTSAWTSFLSVLVVGMTMISVVGCNENKPDYQTQPPVSNAPPPRPVGTIKPANPNRVIEGAALNKIFPPSGRGYKVVYTQEKKGFAQAEVTQNGKKVATISISDTLANPEAKGKFASATQQIDGNPSVSVGDKGSAILVGDRFQVQVRSLSPTLDAAGREGWIQNFNLDALKKLAGE